MIYRRLVNQHLSSAQVILTELVGPTNTALFRQRAFEHSALHLLNSAYLCQLRAIAESYHCSDIAAINSIQSLQTALVAIDTPAPEAREIDTLANEGWLAALLRAQRQLCLPASSKITDQVIPVTTQSDIALRDDSRDVPTFNADKLQQWFLALEDLVQRQGEMMAEY